MTNDIPQSFDRVRWGDYFWRTKIEVKNSLRLAKVGDRIVIGCPGRRPGKERTKTHLLKSIVEWARDRLQLPQGGGREVVGLRADLRHALAVLDLGEAIQQRRNIRACPTRQSGLTFAECGKRDILELALI